jgi:hypothetical protein
LDEHVAGKKFARFELFDEAASAYWQSAVSSVFVGWEEISEKSAECSEMHGLYQVVVEMG